MSPLSLVLLVVSAALAVIAVSNLFAAKNLRKEVGPVLLGILLLSSAALCFSFVQGWLSRIPFAWIAILLSAIALFLIGARKPRPQGTMVLLAIQLVVLTWVTLQLPAGGLDTP